MKNKYEIQDEIIRLSKNVPDEFIDNDMLSITILFELLHDEQGNLSEAATATLYGLAAVLFRKAKFPPAKYADDEGNALWTLEQVAEQLGISVEEVKKGAEQLAKENPNFDTQVVDPKKLNRLQ